MKISRRALNLEKGGTLYTNVTKNWLAEHGDENIKNQVQYMAEQIMKQNATKVRT